MSDLLNTAESLGAAFRARRLARGFDLDQVAQITRIRPQYLDALEAMRLEELPSRPFVVGYIRAYAGALGMDPEQAVARYKRDAPDGEPVMSSPMGVERGDPQFRLAIVLAVVVLTAIVAWNVLRHVVGRGAHNQAAQSAAAAARLPAPSAAPSGTLALGAPLPPPQESTTPQPYVTPGLAPAVSGAAPAAAGQTASPIGTPFETRAAVFGATADKALVILKADKPVTLIVRGSDGSVYFARQLEAGEAYGAPIVDGLSAEVSNPASVSVYVNRALKGPLPAATTALSSLAAPAAPVVVPHAAAPPPPAPAAAQPGAAAK